MSAVVQALFSPNSDAMRQHLDALFGGYLDGLQDGLIELAWTDTRPDDGGKYKLRHARLFGTDQIDELIDEATRLNLQPMCNVYVGAALKHADTQDGARTSDKDALALPAYYTDLDDPGSVAASKDIYGELRPSFVVITGREPHKRAQLWWKLDAPYTDPAHWEDALNGLAVAFNGDTTVTNPGRVMRLAGSVAWPTKPGRTTELTTIVFPNNSRQNYNTIELELPFPPIPVEKKSKIDASAAIVTRSGLFHQKIADGREAYMRKTICAVLLEYIGTTGAAPGAQELFDEAWPQYERSVDLSRPGRGPKEFAEKCAYTLSRFERGKIGGMRTLEEAIHTFGSKPSDKARRDQATAEEKRAEGASGRLLLPASEFLSTFTPPSYLLDGILQTGYLYSLTAKTGAGKTAVSMFLMQCVARGIALHHREVDPGAVLFCAGENPSDIQARYFMLADQFGFDPRSLPIYFIDGVIDIEASLPRIRQEATDIPNLKLVIVDTAAAYFKGDDGNSNTQQGSFARVLRQLSFLPGKPTVLVPCHPIKNASRDNLLPMGGSAFVNEVDGNLTLWSDAEGQTTLHWHTKIRGPEFDPITFRLDTVECDAVKDARGRKMPSVVAKPIGEIEIELGANAAETDENALLRMIALTTKASIAKLAEKCGWLSERGIPNKGKVFRVAQRLLDERLIKKSRGKYIATDAGRKELGLED